MRWFSVLLLVLIAGRCLAAEPFARVAIEDKGAVVPGQQLRLDITVFAPDFFTSPPQFPLFDLPNAMVTLPDERAQNLVETIDGVSYSGIRRVYAIVPETSGDFSLPPVAIELGYSVDGKAVKGQALTPSFRFTVPEAAASTGNTLTFAARNLTLEQTFDRDPSSLKTGDALVRTITVFAEGTQAMMIPAIDVGAPSGLKQYAATAVIKDNVSVEHQSGSTRVQTLTYTVDTSGTFVIPNISYGWYDLAAHRQSTATLPSTNVIVETATSVDQGIAPEIRAPAAGHPLLPEIAIAVVVVLLLAIASWLAWRLRAYFLTRIRTWISAWRNSDRRAFHELMRLIRAAAPKEIELGLRSWAARRGHPSLADWTAGDIALRDQVEKLQCRLYRDDAMDGDLDRKALEQAVVASARHKTDPRSTRSHLPALNPGRPNVPLRR